MKGTIASVALAFIFYGFTYEFGSDKREYEMRAREVCKAQVFARSLCFKAHGSDDTCDDAKYDLDACVMSSLNRLN